MSDLIGTTEDDAFEADVLNASTPVLVDFWAEWCRPCQAIAPVLDAIANEYEGKVKILKMDVDSNTLTPSKYGVRGIPTLLLFKEGNVIGSKSGGNLTKPQLCSFIDSHL